MPMNITLDVDNVNPVAASLVAHGVEVGVKATAVTATYGMLLLTLVKAHAARRPGPRIITGDYNRSIVYRPDVGLGWVGARVETNAPQGRRLEFGFVGVDSLGRHYNQPPYPHFGPALDRVADEYTAAIAAIAA